MLFLFALLMTTHFCMQGRTRDEISPTLFEHTRIFSSPESRNELEGTTVREIAHTLGRIERTTRQRSRYQSTKPETQRTDIEATLAEIFDDDEVLEIEYLEDGGIAVRNPWFSFWFPDMAEASIILAFMLTSGFQITNAIMRKAFYVVAGVIFNAAMTKEAFPLFLYFTTCFYTNWYNLNWHSPTEFWNYMFQDKWWGLALENAMEEILKVLMVVLGRFGTNLSQEKLALYAGLGFATFESLAYVETHVHTVGAMAGRLITFFLHPAFTNLAVKGNGVGLFMAWMIHFWYDVIAFNFMPQIEHICPTDVFAFVLALLLRKGLIQFE